MDIPEILNRLLGDIMPVADQTIDDKRYENIINYEQALESIVYDLIESAKWKNDNRYSANRIGERAYCILETFVENVQDELRIIDETK